MTQLDEVERRLRTGRHRVIEYVNFCRNHPQYDGERTSGSHLIIKAKNGKPVVIKANYMRDTIPIGTECDIRRMMRAAGFMKGDK